MTALKNYLIMVTNMKTEYNTANKNYALLCVDDSKSQLEKYKTDLSSFYNIYCALNYEEAMNIMTYKFPDLILLDVNLSGINGLQLLCAIAGSRSFTGIPVLVVSGCHEIDIIKKAFLNGAVDFIRKPYNSEELKLRIDNQIIQIKKNHNFENYCEAINIRISKDQSKLREAKNTTIYALTELAESLDNETGSHLKRIKKYVLFLCEALSAIKAYQKIMTEEFIEDMYSMSALHDIGKVGICDSILKKTGKLTEDEYNEMKKHTILGGRILKKAYENNTDCLYLKTGMEIALSHHEKWNGKGYPEGLFEDNIPLSARIVTLADVFDTLITRRVYKQAYDRDKVLSIMKSERGITFDPDIYDVFYEIKEKFFNVTELFRSSQPVCF